MNQNSYPAPTQHTSASPQGAPRGSEEWRPRERLDRTDLRTASGVKADTPLPSCPRPSRALLAQSGWRFCLGWMFLSGWFSSLEKGQAMLSLEREEQARGE